MNLPLNRGLQTYFLTQAESETLPVVTLQQNEITVPTFIEQAVKEETVNAENSENSEVVVKTVYRYYPVTLAYKGDDLTSAAKIMRARWDEFREWFYGPQWAQSEMESKGLWTPHAMAVRAVFAQTEGEIPLQLQHFWETYTKFWTLMAGVCIKYNIPYSQVPSEFDSSYLLSLAAQYGITGDELTTLIVQVQLYTFDLLANKYVWKNLFPKPDESEFFSLVSQ